MDCPRLTLPVFLRCLFARIIKSHNVRAAGRFRDLVQLLWVKKPRSSDVRPSQ